MDQLNPNNDLGIGGLLHYRCANCRRRRRLSSQVSSIISRCGASTFVTKEGGSRGGPPQRPGLNGYKRIDLRGLTESRGHRDPQSGGPGVLTQREGSLRVSGWRWYSREESTKPRQEDESRAIQYTGSNPIN